ncbi:MAG: potassium transporter Kup, partial [Gammaproteobacteria bacterium]
RGEGGTLSLLVLASRATSNPRMSALLAVLGIFAAALFYGDSMLTPAVSVISAVEGLQLLAPQLEHYVLPVTVAILSALFMLQRRGSASIGSVFGPVMATWFAVLAGLGIWHIAASPGILAALNPWYAVRLFDEHAGAAFVALGSVVLALTGAEALYADMGHFGKGPIRVAWLGFVSPALILNYFGQGALVLANPEYLENPLYRMVPAWALLPLIILAAMATVTASQAVISGAFSVTRQAFQQKLLPRIMTIHTSASEEGQIYIPFINWSLFVAVIALVLGFRSSSAMAGAYGVAVTGTMLIDTLLLAVVMLCTWKWNRMLMVAALTVFLVVDIAYFSANLMKVPHGGWFPLVIGLVIFTLLTTWRAGRRLLVAQLRREALPIEVFLQALKDVQRVPGTAVFLTSNPEGTPPALLHNMKHNKVVHETVVLLTVRTRDHAQAPRREERLEITPLGEGFYRAQLAFGYLEDQVVPETLRALAPPELPLDPMQTSYFLSRETLLPARRSSMSGWRLALFAWMVRNAASPLKTFHLPPNRVVELGQQIGI